MAQAATARRMNTSSRAATRPRLHVVTGRTPRSSARQTPRCTARQAARYRHLFTLACVALVAFTIFGIARVTLAAQAAATAIESGRLNSEIKAERLVGDLLECDKSALSTPSRIEIIAGESLKMAQAPQVAYLELPASTIADAEPVADPAQASSKQVENRPEQTADSGGFSGMLASVMEMATGEAEVLLVGDAGLASTR